MKPALVFAVLALALVAVHLARPAPRVVATGAPVGYSPANAAHARAGWPPAWVPDVTFTYADRSKQGRIPMSKETPR